MRERLEKANRRGLLERRSQWRRNAEPFGVEVPADLHRVTGLSLVYVLVLRALDQESVLALAGPHPSYTLVVRFHEHVLPRVHELPHFAVEINLRLL